MRISTALKRAATKYGEKAYVRDSKYISSPGARASASARLKAHRAAKPARPTTNDVPGGRTGEEWVEYRLAVRAWKTKEDELLGAALYYRYAVGELTWAFHVYGQGDTWEEALQKAGVAL